MNPQPHALSLAAAELFLVRPMRRVCLLTLVCTLTSCLYPLTVGGPPRSQVADVDVEQIKQLLRDRPPQVPEPAFWAPVRRIWFVRADRAKVIVTDGKAYIELTVFKHAGEWHIDPSTIDIQYLVTS